MTLKWMANRVKMRAWTHVANPLHHLKKRTCVNTQDPFMFADEKQTGMAGQYDNIKTPLTNS